MLFGSLLAGLAFAQLAAGHGAIIKATGDMGGNGTALGIDASTPRDGATRNPFQADSTRFKNNNADACGETLGGGPNEPTAQVAKMVQDSNGMPMISPGGMVMMTLHQVNGDGAGPYKCMIDSTGTGTGGWTDMDVMTNIPGKNSRSKAKAENFPLTAKVAADQKCTGSMGGMDNVCMVRCNNNANAGPFGGCVPVQMVAAGDAAAPKAVAARKADAKVAAVGEAIPNPAATGGSSPITKAALGEATASVAAVGEAIPDPAATGGSSPITKAALGEATASVAAVEEAIPDPASIGGSSPITKAALGEATASVAAAE